jgi:hypothetical protein
MVLMVSFSSRISPCTSTVILRLRLPLATAVVTCAMLRTWAVRLPAMELTLSVKIFPGAGDAAHFGLAAEFAFRAHFARHARHFRREGTELIHHGVDGVLHFQNFAAHVHRDLARKVALGDGRSHFGDVANLRGQVAAMELTLSVRSFQVPATPRTSAWPPSLPSVPTSRATRVTSEAKELS